MAPIAWSTFDLYKDEVEYMVRGKAALAEVEQTIARAALPDDERAALWLFAWALAGKRPRLATLTVR